MLQQLLPLTASSQERSATCADLEQRICDASEVRKLFRAVKAQGPFDQSALNMDGLVSLKR
eukprot:9986742-Alexandrium_andersonii.AAC.1